MTKTNGASLVSIVIPTKNRAGLLRETLDSVRAQTYPHWEAIVVDDGSEDETAEMMAALCADEPRIRYMQRQTETPGAPACRNDGADAAQGDYVIFLDSDDLLAPECLEGRVAVMDSHPEVDFAVYPAEFFDEQPGDKGVLWNVFTSEADLYRFLRGDAPWQTSGPLWRKTSLDGFRWGEKTVGRQDREFHTTALLRGSKYIKVNLPDYYVRRSNHVHDSISKTGNTHKQMINNLRLAELLAREILHCRPGDNRAKTMLLYAFMSEGIRWGSPSEVIEVVQSWRRL